ncbi:hypothetical protein F3K34_40095 [Streptomyces sp. LBUM 1486]|nr:hypothetical protein [Streptomyces sp. LBUM 1485]MBP5918072.1 hypothetical protein [Streptomyces sp. LBUM 1486]QTU52833.1 hypothetical protein F3K21_08000 [Streptomyces sp. LBUM 1480]
MRGSSAGAAPVGLLAQFPAPLKAQAPAGLKANGPAGLESAGRSPGFSGARGTARAPPTHPHPTTHPHKTIHRLPIGPCSGLFPSRFLGDCRNPSPSFPRARSNPCPARSPTPPRPPRPAPPA